MCIPTRAHLTYNNDKPWFTAKLRKLHQAKEDAYRTVDKVLYKQTKYTLEKEIRVAKRKYSDKLRILFSSSDSASVWKGMEDITSYKTPSPSTVENQQQADNLNEFYCRFEYTPHTRPEHLSTQPLTPPATPLSPTPALQISEEDVRQVFREQNRKKHQPVWNPVLTSWPPIFTTIFNRSLELCEVPSCFKRSTIIPISKKPKITGLNDYSPVALTSVVMKSFEKLVLAHLEGITGPSLDPLEFAYRANRSLDDVVNLGLHYVLQHLERPEAYVRILFVDFNSAFKTIIPNFLLPKLTQLSVPTSICQWSNSFLTDRQQLVRLGKYTSAPVWLALELLRAVFSPDCSSTCTWTHPKTPLSSSWSLQMTRHWSASSKTVASLLTDRRLRRWLSGAVLTTCS